METFNEMVCQLFSLNLVLMPSQDARNFFKRKFNFDLPILMNQFNKIDKLNLTIRDLSNHNAYPLHQLRFKFSDIESIKSRPSQVQVKKSLNDCVSNFSATALSSNDTLWYDKWKNLFLQSLELADHEFIGANFGCFFFITDVELENFKEIINTLLVQVKQSSIRWVQPDFLRFFIVISEDTFEPSNTQINNNFNELNTMYSNCYWLRLKNCQDVSDGGDEVFHNDAHDVHEVQSTNESEDSSDLNYHYPDTIIDPLSKLVISNQTRRSSDQSQESPSPVPPSKINENGKIDSIFLPSLPSVILERLNAIDEMLREFIIKTLVPWSEKQIKILSDSISLRKSLKRSILGATRNLFNNISSNVYAKDQSVIYSYEAPEMQQRKLGDLTMCLSMYELAYLSFHSSKKEFQNDGAWLYYAGASEATAIASLCCNKFQRHYFDQAIVTYVDTCKAMNLATRATIFATEAIKLSWPNDAANLYIRMTGDDSDLRSALFLEQASRCFIAAGSRLRKAAFHYILAGHRYNRCGLKHFALACYKQFNCTHWTAAADHANLTISRLYLSIASSQNCPPQKSIEFRNNALEILKLNAHKEPFYNELIRELKEDKDELEKFLNPSNDSITEDQNYHHQKQIQISILQKGVKIYFQTESCLLVENLIDDQIVSLKNLLDDDSILIWTNQNEPIEIPPHLTLHFMIEGESDVINWKTTKSPKNGKILPPRNYR